MTADCSMASNCSGRGLRNVESICSGGSTGSHPIPLGKEEVRDLLGTRLALPFGPSTSQQRIYSFLATITGSRVFALLEIWSRSEDK